jgi:aminoglycoside phosphotransferase (APT) family kinase protein
MPRSASAGSWGHCTPRQPRTLPPTPTAASRSQTALRQRCRTCALGGLVDRRAVLRVWEAAAATPRWRGPAVWLHGDLHPANILVHRGRISGVIDFGDITSGDPATDLSVAWMLLPAGCHGAFRAAYRAANGYPASDDTWTRARGWALALSLAFLAHSADNPLMAEIGQRTIGEVLA